VPVVTIALIVINTAVFLYEISLGPALGPFMAAYGLVPAHVTLGLRYGEVGVAESIAPFFTCMFLHGGWWHLIGNMWFLWIFGDNVEDTLGSVRFLLFYLLCGLAAGAAQYLAQPASALPTVGASGAIAGVLGAYALLFPGAKILTLVPIIFVLQVIEVPAVVMLGIWFLMQILNGSVATLGTATGGVAWWAHIGGFLAGLGLGWVLRPRRTRI
jgi:membrane associated rhomboid family serine protease